MPVYQRPEADLHCHTTASDGLLTPAELIKLAWQRDLKAVGITDHDTIQGWAEAESAGREFGIEVLRGIELNTDWDGIEVHILGYEFYEDSSPLVHRLSDLRQARHHRMIAILQRLTDLGIKLHEPDIMKFAHGQSVGRPHIAQALIEHGWANDIKDAFHRYIGQGAPAYMPRYKISPEEGIKLIRASGGVAVLAHPGVNRLERGIAQWAPAGLQGIEVSHSEHTLEDEERCRLMAKKFNLIMTGGSDFHGEAYKPGVCIGGWGVSLEIVEQIKELANREKMFG